MNVLDLRSLAALRVACALALIADLAVRATNLTAHYTDEGVLPRWAHTYEATLSVHMLGGSPQFEASLFALAAALAVALLVGWRTRVASVLSWWLLLSLQERNPLVLTMGDNLFLLVLFWGMFLPWGARWSLDSRRRPWEGPNRVAGLACLGYAVQMAVIYPLTALLKTGPEWSRDGTAVYYALTAAQYETPLGQALRAVIIHHPWLSSLLTHGTLLLEFALGALLLIPSGRLLGVVGVWLFQLSLGLCLALGFFPVFASVAVVGLVPWPGPEETRALPEKASRLVLGAALVLAVCAPRTVGLQQEWYMFAPSPPTVGGWYLMVGRTRDGQLVDLTHDSPLTWERPANVPAFLGGMRWEMYLFRVLTRTNWANQRAVYARYLSRQSRLPLEGVRLIYMQARTVPFGRESPATPTVLWGQAASPGGLSGFVEP